MRQLFSRPMALVVCALAVSLAGCSSKNKDKIVGKWKFVSAPGGGGEEQMKKMLEAKMYLFMDFKADGTFEVGVGSDDPDVAKFAAAMSGDKAALKGKYKLLSGNGVEMSGLEGENAKAFFKGGKDKGRGDIIINGDEMTLKDSDGAVTKLRAVK